MSKTTIIFLIGAGVYAPLVFQYGWFQLVTPFGLPELSYWHSLGLTWLIGAFFNWSLPREDERVSEAGIVSRLVFLAVSHLIFWVVGGQS